MPYAPLTESTAIDFARGIPAVAAFFGPAAAAPSGLICQDLADGNVNLVFRLSSVTEPSKSLILKQALPHARRYPEFKMPLDRARIERDALDVYAQVAPNIAPRVLAFDPDLFVTVMEDLATHRIMRESTVTQAQHPSFAPTLGRFLARSLFFTSDLALDSAEKKRRVASLSNPVLCKVTEDLVFTFPFAPHPTNRFPAGLQGAVDALHRDPTVRRAAARARFRFMTGAEAMVHGDLHTGSIMVSATETRVIDPEFAFYGPIGFDPGMLIANLAIAFFAQDFHANDPANRRAYQSWLKSAALETLAVFQREFSECFAQHAHPHWRQDASPGALAELWSQIERDALGACGCEMIRRTIGLAHVSELDAITDEHALVAVSTKILDSARLALTADLRSLNHLVESWTA